VLVLPFRVFGLTAQPWVSPPRVVLLGLATRSELLASCGTAPMWLSDPTLPLAVSSAARSSRKKRRWSRLSVQSNPLFEFRLPIESYPVKPSQSAAADRLLSWAFVPYSTSGIKDPLAAGSPARYVPPSGFGYPPDGLRPSIPCRFCFTPAALMGFTLRSFLLSKGT